MAGWTVCWRRVRLRTDVRSAWWLTGRWLAPPRFLLFLVTFGTALVGLHAGGLVGRWADALALAFDTAAALFLASLVPLLRASDAAAMRRSARRNDANRLTVLGLTTVLTVVVLAAIAGELPRASGGSPWAMVRLIGTLALTWLFANTVYALHYAHLFYSHGSEMRDPGADHHGGWGLEFPGTTCPGYSDFAYFAFTLGMTFQTSDVVITSPVVRRIATLHGFAAFVFNIGVIAFTINALGGSASVGSGTGSAH